MISVQLDPETDRRLLALAQKTGRTPADCARDLIEGSLEDLEDRYMAEARLG